MNENDESLILDIEAAVDSASRLPLIEVPARRASPLDGKAAVDALRVAPAGGAIVEQRLGGALPVHYGAGPLLAQLGRVVIKLAVAAQEQLRGEHRVCRRFLQADVIHAGMVRDRPASRGLAGWDHQITIRVRGKLHSAEARVHVISIPQLTSQECGGLFRFGGLRRVRRANEILGSVERVREESDLTAVQSVILHVRVAVGVGARGAVPGDVGAAAAFAGGDAVLPEEVSVAEVDALGHAVAGGAEGPGRGASARSHVLQPRDPPGDGVQHVGDGFARCLKHYKKT